MSEPVAATTTEQEKRVSWAELFFDLVFVVAVTRVSTLLEHDHSWGGVLRALVVFVPIYWTWVGMAIQTNQGDTSSVSMRLRMFAVALAGIYMALALGEAYGDLGLMFAVSYWAARLLLASGLFRSQGLRAALWTPYGVSVVVTGPLLMIGALLDDVTAQTAVWGVAALIDLSAPSLFRRRLSRLHYDAAHLSERFGLFVLIALGESVVAVGTSTSTDDLRAIDAAAVAAAFVLSCGLWWVYFHFAADAVRHALATAQVQLRVDPARAVVRPPRLHRRDHRRRRGDARLDRPPGRAPARGRRRPARGRNCPVSRDLRLHPLGDVPPRVVDPPDRGSRRSRPGVPADGLCHGLGEPRACWPRCSSGSTWSSTPVSSGSVGGPCSRLATAERPPELARRHVGVASCTPRTERARV